MDRPRPPQQRKWSLVADALGFIALVAVALLVLAALVYGVVMAWSQIG